MFSNIYLYIYILAVNNYPFVPQKFKSKLFLLHPSLSADYKMQKFLNFCGTEKRKSRQLCVAVHHSIYLNWQKNIYLYLENDRNSIVLQKFRSTSDKNKLLRNFQQSVKLKIILSLSRPDLWQHFRICLSTLLKVCSKLLGHSMV